MDANSEFSRATYVRKRGMKLHAFCERYGIGNTKAYEEINAKRLEARKCGKSTIITEDAAERWLRSLPVISESKRRKSAMQRRGGVS